MKLKEYIDNQVKKQLTEAPLWKTENLGNWFYNFWASIGVVHKSMGLFMDKMNAKKPNEAFQMLKISYHELQDVKKELDKTMENIKKELDHNNIK